MKTLSSYPLLSFILTVLLGLIGAMVASYYLIKMWYSKEEILQPLTIIWSIIAFIVNSIIKMYDQQRLNESTIIDNNIKLMAEFSRLAHNVNLWEFRTEQVAIIYWMAELARKHSILKLPAIKSLEDIKQWYSWLDAKKVLKNAAIEARDSIK